MSVGISIRTLPNHEEHHKAYHLILAPYPPTTIDSIQIEPDSGGGIEERKVKRMRTSYERILPYNHGDDWTSQKPIRSHSRRKRARKAKGKSKRVDHGSHQQKPLRPPFHILSVVGIFNCAVFAQR
jgi:hypothetical protein